MTSPSRVRDAVILMAGTGSRLRVKTEELPKPLFPFLGRPLVVYIMEALARAGVRNLYAVTGYKHELMTAQLAGFAPPGTKLHFIQNTEFQKQNGVSVLSAAESVPSPFLLTMSDHLFDDAVVETMASQPEPDCIAVAVDRKIQSVFDLPDAMKIKTTGNQVEEISKNLVDFDAIDTGLFICSKTFFGYLERAKKDGDVSLADGVRLAAQSGKAQVVDIGEAWWQDVDTPEMFSEAERRFARSLGR